MQKNSKFRTSKISATVVNLIQDISGTGDWRVGSDSRNSIFSGGRCVSERLEVCIGNLMFWDKQLVLDTAIFSLIFLEISIVTV